ncbi:MAG: alpha/beta hydrolase [Candidatus Scalindua sp. AMX11]|nr:MAG: alpha/beta hydrolase [Candidatus Scalindua sp.]NOG83324.1 alpha/beta hydrolase [Planctomycetota bacterium]RZV76776.1 MAG: alpha/beta hydrolase [Candidatus Scalindua sp. SCAELEC01]TDE63160.1 MAG: alpha/beta hydrolase [Candidatus Scalindua sp. AMX11]GJQ57582.1 MAG: hypothetical protein SCALA701_03830 [Candidatus Scalindua sp.]
MIYELSFRGPGGSVNSGILSPYEDLGNVIVAEHALIGYEQVTFLIHGFKVNKQAGRNSLSRLAKILANKGNAVVFVLWPGDSPIGPFSYSFTEGYQADDTAVQLARFIENHIGNVNPVNFIAHSLGCRVTLETINILYKMAEGDQDIYPVNQICLLAAAVDDYSLSVPEKYKISAERTQRVVVLHSVKDKILRRYYPLGDLLQAFIFFWKESFGFALGYHGPKNIQSKRNFGNQYKNRKRKHYVATKVFPMKIDKKYNVDHGDYLPPSNNSAHLNDKQEAIANLVSNALEGESELVYKI